MSTTAEGTPSTESLISSRERKAVGLLGPGIRIRVCSNKLSPFSANRAPFSEPHVIGFDIPFWCVILAPGLEIMASYSPCYQTLEHCHGTPHSSTPTTWSDGESRCGDRFV
ncbi:hypothetical protein JHW43_007785 [Diplocarpon mali]|nr:hypothetical protein JHW43_007785 [Diplocarpon mali]